MKARWNNARNSRELEVEKCAALQQRVAEVTSRSDGGAFGEYCVAIVWDAERERIVANPQADQFVGVKYRRPWELHYAKRN